MSIEIDVIAAEPPLSYKVMLDVWSRAAETQPPFGHYSLFYAALHACHFPFTQDFQLRKCLASV